MAVFWDGALCGLVEVYRRFGCACCFHHQGNNDLLLRNFGFQGILFITLFTTVHFPIILDR
jgi:hypothetical protein